MIERKQNIFTNTIFIKLKTPINVSIFDAHSSYWKFHGQLYNILLDLARGKFWEEIIPLCLSNKWSFIENYKHYKTYLKKKKIGLFLACILFTWTFKTESIFLRTPGIQDSRKITEKICIVIKQNVHIFVINIVFPLCVSLEN